jgi:hypothetical protein
VRGFFLPLGAEKGNKSGARAELLSEVPPLSASTPRQRQNKEVKETRNDRGRRGFGCNEEREERKE